MFSCEVYMEFSNCVPMKLLMNLTVISFMLSDILRTMQTSEDSSIYDKVVTAIFDEEILSIKDQHQHTSRFRLPGGGSSSIYYADSDTEVRDYVTEISKEVFRKHCAKHLEIIPMRLLDDCPQFNRFST